MGMANNNNLKLQNSSRGGAIVYQINENEHTNHPINILDDKEDASAATFIQDLERRSSDEEWLEDLYNDDYAPKQKKIKSHIKQEVEDFDNDSLTSFYSSIKQESCNDSIISQKSTPSDEYSIFGEYIAHRLQKIKSPHTSGNVKQIITTVLWQAEYGSYDDVDPASILSLTTNPKPNLTPAATTDNVDTLTTKAVLTDQ